MTTARPNAILRKEWSTGRGVSSLRRESVSRLVIAIVDELSTHRGRHGYAPVTRRGPQRAHEGRRQKADQRPRGHRARSLAQTSRTTSSSREETGSGRSKGEPFKASSKTSNANADRNASVAVGESCRSAARSRAAAAL